MTQLDTPSRTETSNCLFRDAEQDIVIERAFGVEDRFFDQVIDVRKDGDGPIHNSFDPYSYHYLLRHQGTPVGTMTLTWLADGEIDCQEYYPERLLHLYHDQVISGTKLRINRGECSSLKTLRQFIGCVWQDHVKRGCRLNVMNAERRLAPFYRRLGFQVIEDSDFTHPTLRTESVVLVLAVDPNHRSFFQSIFELSEHPLSQREAIEACQPIFPSQSRVNSHSMVPVESGMPRELETSP